MGLGTIELLILITGTLSALASAIVTVVNGVRTKVKLEKIAADTNGNLSAVKTELTRANTTVAALHEVVHALAEPRAVVPVPAPPAGTPRGRRADD